MSSFFVARPKQHADFAFRGWFIHGNAGAWNVVYCNMTAVDVVYTYEDSRYQVHDSSPTSLQYARYIAAVGLPTALDLTETTVDGVPPSEWEEAYGLELSRRVLGHSAWLLYEPQNATEVNWQFVTIGSELNIAPLIILVTGMATYGCASWLRYVSPSTDSRSAQLPGAHRHPSGCLDDSAGALCTTRLTVLHRAPRDRACALWAR
jgi:hypothetical protein